MVPKKINLLFCTYAILSPSLFIFALVSIVTAPSTKHLTTLFRTTINICSTATLLHAS